MIYLTAVVERAYEKTEKLSGTSFVHCVAETTGMKLDVILAGDQKPRQRPSKGHILEGWFVLSGTVSRHS